MKKENKTEKSLPKVVIFGRTNVGKSTLFNCLRGAKQALVSNIEGTTRDSNIGEVEWQNRTFELIDTGGILDLKNIEPRKLNSDDVDVLVQRQAKEYIKQADLILFVVDTRTGLLVQDSQMAMFLKKRYPTDKIRLVANKADNPRLRGQIAEFHKLGLGTPWAISASNGSGTGDLLDEVVSLLPAATAEKIIEPEDEIEDEPTDEKDKTNKDREIRVCILGKPNVGKSSLLNSILGYKRVMVSPVAHTTREPQDTKLEYKDKKITIVDTAGISRRGLKSEGLEKFGIIKTLETLNKADIAVLVLDIKEGITHQDAKLIEEILERKKSFFLLANKWDLVEERDTLKYTQAIRNELPFVPWVPIHFASALTGAKVNKIMDLVLEIAAQRKTTVGDAKLDRFLKTIIKKHPPAKAKGPFRPYIYEVRQTRENPPRFELRLRSRDSIHFSYMRFIENQLREHFGFLGTPITVEVVRQHRRHGQGLELINPWNKNNSSDEQEVGDSGAELNKQKEQEEKIAERKKKAAKVIAAKKKDNIGKGRSKTERMKRLKRKGLL